MRTAAACLTLVALAAISPAHAQQTTTGVEQVRSISGRSSEPEPTPLDIFRFESAYVFESDFDRGFGPQDAFHLNTEYAHRFHLGGRIYLRTGIGYERFEFGDSFAPVPTHLQSMAGIIALDYMVGKDTGAFIQIRPGFYTENDIGINSFDVPITLGRVFILQQDKLYLFVGATAGFLRGQYPVLPVAGLVWRPSEQWNIFALVPDPRITWSPTRQFGVWVGGQFAGSSFRTDRDSRIVPRELSGAQVDYFEYRVGGGIEWRPTEQVAVDLGGGYVIERSFNFERAGREYSLEGAPFLRAAVKAEF